MDTIKLWNISFRKMPPLLQGPRYRKSRGGLLRISYCWSVLFLAATESILFWIFFFKLYTFALTFYFCFSDISLSLFVFLYVKFMFPEVECSSCKPQCLDLHYPNFSILLILRKEKIALNHCWDLRASLILYRSFKYIFFLSGI